MSIKRSEATAVGANPGKHAVGIVGVGNMGGGMAINLLRQGWTVHVHDTDAAKLDRMQSMGGFRHDTIAKLAINCVVLIVCVVTAEQAESVLFGPGANVGADVGANVGAERPPLADQLDARHTVLLCPTMAPEDVERIAQRLGARGVAVIDAPMSGGPARAADGTMSLMLAAPDAVIAANLPLLQALSNKRFVVSQRPGDGARTKLVNNLLAGINLVGAAEALALAQRLGLDRATMLDVIEQSSGQSWIGSDRMRRVLAQDGAGDYAPRAHMTLLQKDTALAVAAAQSVGFSGPLGQAAAQVFDDAARAGLADEDDAAVYKQIQSLPTPSPNP